MSLTNPVISDLVVATYEQDRRAEVARLSVRTSATPPVIRYGERLVARGIGRLRDLTLVRNGRLGWTEPTRLTAGHESRRCS